MTNLFKIAAIIWYLAMAVTVLASAFAATFDFHVPLFLKGLAAGTFCVLVGHEIRDLVDL